MKEDYLKYLRKCFSDPVFFIENEFRLEGIGLESLIRLSDYQKDMIRHIHENRNSSFRICRQAGTTTIFAAYATWYAIHQTGKHIFIHSHSVQDSRRILDIVRYAITHLPEYYNPELLTNNRAMMELANETYISAGTASAARGRSIDLLILDNADYGSKDDMRDLLPAVCANPQSKITACGGDFNFPLMKISWDQIPGRSPGWKDKMVDFIGTERFKIEYELS